MKNKKILVFVVIVLCIISMFFIGLSYYRDSSNVSSIEMKESNETTTNNTTKEIAASITEDNSTKQETIIESDNSQDQKITTNEQKQSTQEKKTQETSNTKTTTKSQVAENKPSTQVIEKPATSSNKKTETVKPPANTPPPTTIPESTPSTTPPAKDNTESFKVNNTIINQMKSIINSNQSSYMKQFGYNIVVDSSIVNQTTGFTYTETRVKNAIANSFGTIRIYARDYYVGNELRWTESFIL